MPFEIKLKKYNHRFSVIEITQCKRQDLSGTFKLNSPSCWTFCGVKRDTPPPPPLPHRMKQAYYLLPPVG